MTTTDIDVDVEAVRAELEACEQVQSWAPGSTRSSWTGELRAIIEAYEQNAAERLAEAVSQAKERAFELAEKVARGLATDVDGLRTR